MSEPQQSSEQKAAPEARVLVDRSQDSVRVAIQWDVEVETKRPDGKGREVSVILSNETFVNIMNQAKIKAELEEVKE